MTTLIENRTFDELQPGDRASLTRSLSERDIELFAAMSGDVNPAHVDPDYARSDMFHHVIAHGMWCGTLISTVLGTLLPGPGTIYLEQSLRFLHPVYPGDTVTVSASVGEKRAEHRHVVLACEAVNQDGVAVVSGSADVIAPLDKVSRPRAVLPEVVLDGQAVAAVNSTVYRSWIDAGHA